MTARTYLHMFQYCDPPVRAHDVALDEACMPRCAAPLSAEHKRLLARRRQWLCRLRGGWLGDPLVARGRPKPSLHAFNCTRPSMVQRFARRSSRGRCQNEFLMTMRSLHRRLIEDIGAAVYPQREESMLGSVRDWRVYDTLVWAHLLSMLSSCDTSKQCDGASLQPLSLLTA